MNILIDGNAFLNVSTSIVKNMLQNDKRIGEKYFVNDLLDDSKFSLKSQAASTFRNFVLNYFSSIISPFKGNVGAVFFVFDAKSWRKEYIKTFFKEGGADATFEYKGNRKYDDKMYLFFEYFQTEILPELKKMEAVSARLVGAEGDDLIAHVVRNTTEDTCIWSVDKDLIQLLENGKRLVFLVTPKMMTKNKRVFIANRSEQASTVDIFNLGDSVSNSSADEILKELINRDFVKYEVDPTEELIVKVLGGDSSDAIPRVHPKMTKAKIESIVSSLKADSAEWKSLLTRLREMEPAAIDKISRLAYPELKISSQDAQDNFVKALTFNIKIICLDINHVPEHISELIKESFDFNSIKRFDLTSFKKYHSIKQ